MINTIKKVIAVLLVFTVIVLAACSVDLSPVKAAEIGNSVNLDGYGEYISNDELGELVSYGGYISKREYAAQLSDNSVGASYNPRFAGCYDTNGYQITVRRAMAGHDLCERFESILHSARCGIKYRLISDTNNLKRRVGKSVG